MTKVVAVAARVEARCTGECHDLGLVQLQKAILGALAPVVGQRRTHEPPGPRR